MCLIYQNSVVECYIGFGFWHNASLFKNSQNKCRNFIIWKGYTSQNHSFPSGCYGTFPYCDVLFIEITNKTKCNWFYRITLNEFYINIILIFTIYIMYFLSQFFYLVYYESVGHEFEPHTLFTSPNIFKSYIFG